MINKPSTSTSTETADDDLGESLEALSLADRAYERIEAIILSGKLKSGERLNDSKLAKAFSISRGPVRSALTRLAEAGLVDQIPYRGAFVRTIDLDEVLEIYEVRAAVERAGARAACRNMTPVMLAQLSEYGDAMDDSFRKGDKERYFELNLAFHQFIHQASGNSRLLDLYERYTREQKLFRHFSVVRTSLEESHSEHQRILQAFKNGDCDAVAAAMENHVLSSKQRLEQSMKKIKNDYLPL